MSDRAPASQHGPGAAVRRLAAADPGNAPASRGTDPPFPVETLQPILPDRFSPRFVRVFHWYARRLVCKRFHALRVLTSDLAALVALEGHRSPVIVLMNHASWWDPLIAVLLGVRFAPTRSACAPMDIDQLRRFAFFRRLGLFGIDLDDRRGAQAMTEHVLERFRADARQTFWITPEGRFTDVRAPLRVRAGAALVAARTPGVRVIAVAVEYAFWQDARPEILLAAQEVAPPPSSDDATQARRAVPAWHRAMLVSMQAARERLAAAVIARSAEPFTSIVGDGEARIHPVYDLWLRLRGRRGPVRARGAGS